jgi:hypothetical protein
VYPLSGDEIVFMFSHKTKTIDVASYVIINETGNVLIKSSLDPANKLPDLAEKIFLEAVSSLCLITTAISRSIDPATNRPFSIYDHSALERILVQHPLFVHLGRESAEYRIRRNQDLVTKSSNDLFGVSGSYAAQRKISSIYSSMYGAAQVMAGAGDSRNVRIGHLMLCCEYLMGIPLVTAVLMHISQEQCVKLSKQVKKSWWDFTSERISLQKDTYLFNSHTLLKMLDVDNYQQLLEHPLVQMKIAK